MLIMDINSRDSSVTMATVIVLTSSSVAFIFVTSGLVLWSYAVFFFFVCFAGTIFGKRKIDKTTGRASVLGIYYPLCGDWCACDYVQLAG